MIRNISGLYLTQQLFQSWTRPLWLWYWYSLSPLHVSVLIKIKHVISIPLLLSDTPSLIQPRADTRFLLWSPFLRSPPFEPPADVPCNSDDSFPSDSDQSRRGYICSIGNEIILNDLENNQPPIQVDECAKFGRSESNGVTAWNEGYVMRIHPPNCETIGGGRSSKNAQRGIDGFSTHLTGWNNKE